jgi:uncharacterized protein (DUF3084 family)
MTYNFALANERAYSAKAVGSLQEANATIHRLNGLIDQWDRAVKQRDAIIEDQKARIAGLELALASKTAHGLGLEAYLAMFKAAHPGSPVLADSGKRYKNGAVKTAGAIAYEQTFDRYGAEKRITNFKQYRAD